MRACPELPQDDLGPAKPKKHLTGAGSALLPVAVEEEQGLVPTVWPGHSAGPSDWRERGGGGRSRSGRSFNLSQLKEPCWFSRALTSSFRGPHVVMSTLLNRSIIFFLSSVLF